MSEARSDAGGRLADLTGLLLAWGIAVALIDPRGDFPLNDDWAYALTVRRLLSDGTFHPPAWAAPALLSQTLWGALAALPAGFSHTALRLATLLLGAGALALTYLIGRALRAPRALAALAALTLAGGPVFLALAHTFMTDVPFVAFALLAVAGFAHHLRGGAGGALALGIAGSLAATLCRQVGLVLPVAFAAATLLAGTGRWRGRLLRALLPAAVSAAALAALQLWGAAARADALGAGDVLVAWRFRHDPVALFRFLATNLVIAWLYTGLFLTPLLLAVTPHWRRRWRRPRAHDGLWALTLVGLAAWLWHTARLMPLRGNVLIASGVGPVTLRDWYILGLPHDGPLPAPFWLGVTALAVLGGALLAVHLASAAAVIRHPTTGDEIATRATRLMLLLAAGASLAAVLLTSPFDRYYLPLVALLALAVLPPGAAAPPRATAAAGALLAVMAAFSIAATHDYLAWNRARWQGLEALAAAGVPPHRIDGGAEFNGLHLFRADYRARPGKSWWWVEDDEYVLTMGPLPGYGPAQRYPYRRWLPPGTGEIFVLQRAP